MKRDGWRVLNPLFFQVLLTPEKTRETIGKLEQVLTDMKSADKKSKELAKVINDLRRWGLYIAYEDNILLPIWKKPRKIDKIRLIQADELVNKFYNTGRPLYLFWAHLRNNMFAHLIFTSLYKDEKVPLERFINVAVEVVKNTLDSPKILSAISNRERFVKHYLKPLQNASEGELEIRGNSVILRLSLNTLYGAEITGISEEGYLKAFLTAWEALLRERGHYEEWRRGGHFVYSLKQIVEKMPENFRAMSLEDHLKYVKRIATTYPWLKLYEDFINYKPEQWERYLIELISV